MGSDAHPTLRPSTRNVRIPRGEDSIIAVLAIPSDDAQDVVDRMIAAGVRAILNFAPAQISVPPHVSLKSVNMAMELEGLSFALTNSQINHGAV